MIPDFRGLSLVNYGDKAIIFLPHSGYGERGAGGVIQMPI
jgi:FKBP-type peptidyl-prolyl cis-trans isomerase